MNFIKCEALGNEFIVLIDTPLPPPALAINMCNPTLGPGGDGVVHLTSKKACSSLWHTTIINSDGTDGGFSGNGLRCGALCLNTEKLRFAIADKIVTAIVKRSKVSLFFDNDCSDSMKNLTDSMTAIDFGKLLKVRKTSLSYIDIGNPHLIINTCGEGVMLTEAVKNRLNKLRQPQTLLGKGINVTVMTDSAENDEDVKLTTFERGVGITPSCGSAALAAFISMKNENPTVKLARFTSKGGTIELFERDDEIVMTGNVKKIFDGTYDMVNNEYGKR